MDICVHLFLKRVIGVSLGIKVWSCNRRKDLPLIQSNTYGDKCIEVHIHGSVQSYVRKTPHNLCTRAYLCTLTVSPHRDTN